MRYLKLGLILPCLIIFSGCQKDPEPAEPEVQSDPEPAPEPKKAWIGAQLRASRDLGDEIRIYPQYVLIEDVLPFTPAATVLKNGDVILSVNGIDVSTPKDVVEIISGWNHYFELEMRVRREKRKKTVEKVVYLYPEPRPTPDEYLRELFLENPLPPFDRRVSIAKVREDGNIVPDSQCVMTRRKSCPPFGKVGRTDMSIGNATVVYFWDTWPFRKEKVAKGFSILGDLYEKYGGSGLEIIAVTSDQPYEVSEYFAEAKDHPPMTVMTSSLYHGRLKYIDKAAPSMLVLDIEGNVQEVCIWSEEDWTLGCAEVLEDVLDLGE